MMRFVFLFLLIVGLSQYSLAQVWDGYGGNAQHTALSDIASQPLQAVHWDTPTDLYPQFSKNGDLYTHYGSPVITTGNTVIVPVKTGASGGFELNAFNGSTGTELWSQPTDYALPPQSGGAYYWTPPYSPALSGGTMYYAGDGGTVYERSSLNTSGTVTPTQVAFYGSLANYQANTAAYNANVAISTPITADAQGDIYFGYTTTSSAPGGLASGVARISSTGVGKFFPADQLMAGASNAGMTQVQTNAAPVLSPDGSTVYVAMSAGEDSQGRLVALNATTLAPQSSVLLMDPKSGEPAVVSNESTASPMVGPDGDVYMGVLDNEGTSRGWLEHYSADLSMTKTTGGFGWDDTASIVPASMVPGYHGSSSYLIMTKYNYYAGYGGGNGQNKLAILDPNATQTNELNNTSGVTEMKEVETVLGPTLDEDVQSQYPGAVDEWCDNSAVVDPATDSVLVNSEDGNLYRWNLLSNTLTEVVNITNGVGEAYTPTEIGPDGTVYGINNATLWAVGATGNNVYSTWTATGGGNWSGSANWSGGIPTNAGDVATFDSTISSASEINLNTAWTVGTLNFYSGPSYTLAAGSGGSLTINNGANAGQINVEYGSHTIAAPVTLASNLTIAVGQTNSVLTISGNIGGAGGLTVGPTATALAAGMVVLSGSNNFSGGTTVAGGTLEIAAHGALPDGPVTISGGTLQLEQNTGLAQVTSLSISGSGVLDLTNNHLIVTYTGTSPIGTIAAEIASAYSGGTEAGPGTWRGPGITSSLLPGNSAYGIGYADAADAGNPAGLAAGQIEIMYTLLGDANLDGKVNGTDFLLLATSFSQSGKSWDQGDFNYDGNVNGTDFLLLADNFNQFASQSDVSVADLAALDSFAAANGISLTNVPEPGAGGMIVLVAGGMAWARRERHSN